MIPTRDVPQGLSADEYFRLSIQYMLLGWNRQMVSAAKLAIDQRADLASKLPYNLSAEDYEKIGVALGVVEGAMDIAVTASGVFRETWLLFRDAFKSVDLVLEETDGVRDIKREVNDALRAIAREAQGLFDKAVEGFVLPMLGFPGRDLPENLTPAEYFDLAKTYKDMGWCEQARDALERAIETTTDVKLGERARLYLRTRIPRMPVPHRAVEENVRAHHLIVRGELQSAKRKLKRITNEYADFEWARGNLGLVYSKLGELENAEDILSAVLDYNPNYLNGWLHLARLKAAKLELKEAGRYIEKAHALDPEDQGAIALEQLIHVLSL